MTTLSTKYYVPPVNSVDVKITTVTVIVPVRNEEAHIEHTINQLIDQHCDKITLEILVVDGHSTDRTREIVARLAKSDPRIRLLKNAKQLSSAARNLAIHNSSGEYIVIIDGHCEIPSRDYFRTLVHAFEESGADCLGRPQPLDVEHATSTQKAIAAARSSLFGHHPESFIYSNHPQYVPAKSVAIAYRRDVFARIGFFDETFDAHEDGEFNYRCDQARLRCRLIPDLTVKYEPRKSLGGLFYQLFRYGRGRMRFFHKHHAAICLGTLIPAVFVLAVVLGLPLCMAIPAFWSIYLSTVAFYVGLTLLESVRLAFAFHTPYMLYRLPAIFWVIHIASGCGLLWEFYTLSRTLLTKK